MDEILIIKCKFVDSDSNAGSSSCYAVSAINITKTESALSVHHVRRKKTAPFYFCNNFTKTLTIITILAHIYFQ